MLSKDQVSNLISYAKDRVSYIKKYGDERDMDAFEYEFTHFLDCVGYEAVIEEGHLVDLREF